MKPFRVVLLLVMAAAGLTLALMSRRAEPEQPRYRIVEIGTGLSEAADPGGDADPEHGPAMSIRSRSMASDQVDYLAQLPPALGRTFWVGAGRGTGDGSRDAPWRDVASAVPALRGGDRLVLLPGRYRGPLVLPDFDGEDPIQVVGARSPVFRNPDDAEAPVIRIEGRWHLIGVEIQPGASSTGIEIATDQEVELRFLHINSGGRDGIVIGESARDVTILESHVHHVGGTDGAGIRIVEGARDLNLIRNKVHGTGGDPILLFAPGRFSEVATGRDGARRARVPELGITIVEDPWEP